MAVLREASGKRGDMMKLGILGATGWVGQALGLRLIGQGWAESDLVLSNRRASRAAYGAGVVWGGAAAVSAAEVILITVRPEDFPVPGFDPGDRLVISFMTMWTLEKLRRLYPAARIVRAMPNGAASVGRSYTPWVGEVSEADAALVGQVLASIGGQDRVVDEDQLDYLAALSGSGSAYPALMAQAMLRDALARGLPEAVARAAVEAVVCGSAPFLEGKMGEVGAILDVYRGYKGVTAAGLDAAEPELSRAIAAALAAATAKAKALGQ